jgi:hypothetical protein
MRKTLFVLFACALVCGNLMAQQPVRNSHVAPASNATQTPGLDVLGYGYDVFGSYADQKSKKRYCLFKYSNFSETPIGSYLYSVPQFVFLENISNHIVKTVSGESIRDYASSLSVKAGLEGETMFFKGSINSSFDKSVTGTEQHFFFTYMDANTKWRISFDERRLANLKIILDPDFVKDLATMDPVELFALYGTHYIASAFLGGRADFTSESVIKSTTKTQDISVAVEAKFKVVSGSGSLDSKNAETLNKSETKTKLTVVGGNSQYANDISDKETYRLWADGIERMPVLCDFDKNSLKPIWDFCDSPARKAVLIAHFNKMCAENPLPKSFANLGAIAANAYMVKNKAANLYWDFAGFNTNAEQKGGMLMISPKDGNSHKGQGFDRIFKFQSHEMEPEWVHIQPQHCNLSLDITGGIMQPGTKIQAWDRGPENISQLFALEPVDGEPNTYFIKTKNGLYIEIPEANLTAGSGVVINKFSGKNNQKWVFESFDPKNIAQPSNGAYAIQCVAGGNYWDFAGTYPEVRDNKLQLWTPGNAIGDRTIKIAQRGEYFVMRPNHHPKNLLTSESKKQLNTSNQTSADNQLFYCEYAGVPSGYIIVNKATNEVIAAHGGQTNVAGCSVNSWPKDGGENQKWILHGLSAVKKVLHEDTYFVKVESSNKYWDLAGKETENNKNHVKAQIWDRDGGSDQKVKFVPSDDEGYYYIEFQNGNKRLDVSGPWNITSMSMVDQAKYRSGQSDIKLKKDKGAKLQAYEATGKDSQKFKIIHVGNSVFCFRSKIEDRAIDISGGKINDNGPDLQMWDADNNKAAQRFVFISTNDNKQFVY